MLRTIKFRAWDKKRKQLFPVHELEWDKISHSLTKCVGYDDWDNDGYTMHGGGNMKFANGDRYILMQYTGIKDKNGKEIYDGDIVESKFAIYTICWNDKRAQFIVKVEKTESVLTRHASFPLWQYVDDDGECRIEVIGNIYEHPHLLEARIDPETTAQPSDSGGRNPE